MPVQRVARRAVHCDRVRVPMLLACILLYFLFTLSLGVIASRRIHGARDFMVAGRSLPFFMGFTCVFATWFGAETVLSVSSHFASHGLKEIPGDPLGFSVCLILVAVFFAKHFYRMDLLTIGDYYHKRFGKGVEMFTSIAITLSYLGWCAAQLTALGLVMSVVGQHFGFEWLNIKTGIVIGAVVVLFYTFLGGMWSVALTDVIQTVVIVAGLLFVAYFMAGQAGGVAHVVEQARTQGNLQFWPDPGFESWLTYIAAFLTAALGSIPQQDVFQRVMSSKDEKTAVRATFFGGLFYFVFAFVPMFIAFSAIVIDSAMAERFAGEDQQAVQRILPQLVLDKTPFLAQVMFLGALLSAIMSTASGTLLAPASLFTENILRPLIPSVNDKRLLWCVRTALIFFAAGATLFAINNSGTMYDMVLEAYSVPLVAAFVPLVMGIYWKRSTTQGAVWSIFAGVCVWLPLLLLNKHVDLPSAEAVESSFRIIPTAIASWLHQQATWLDEACRFTIFPPQLAGLIASFIGMVLGSLAPQWIVDKREPVDPR